MDNLKKIFAERRASSVERRALNDCLHNYSQAANDIERIALQDYTASLCLIDLDLHQDRENWKVDNDQVTQRMTSYFQSSQYKNAFARLMGYAYYVKQPSTISWISQRIVISRTAAHQFVRDCLAEKWITAVQISDKTTGYWASNVLIKGLEEHARYTQDKVESTGVSATGALFKIAKNRKAALHSTQYQNVAE